MATSAYHCKNKLTSIIIKKYSDGAKSKNNSLTNILASSSSQPFLSQATGTMKHDYCLYFYLMSDRFPVSHFANSFLLTDEDHYNNLPLVMKIWHMGRKVLERDKLYKFGIQSVEKVSFYNKKIVVGLPEVVSN